MGKIAIVGVEGSGKTVLMAALTECYQKISDTEPYLMPENHSAFLFMQQVPHKLRVAREWPGATGIDSLRTMKWTLRCGTEIVQEIEMLDYPGELYRHAFGERKPAEVAAHRAELDEFLGHLTDAEMLVVLFNLADLEDLGTNARNVEAVWITKGIFDFAQKLPNLKRQLLVFTQADRYAATLKAHGGAQGLYAAKMPMLKVLHPDLPVTAIAAVDGTDDEGRPKADYSSAACHELMRLILHDADDLAKSYVKDCEQCAAALQNFTGGDVPAFQSECREYEAAFNNLSNAARPLSYAYRVALAAHKNKLSLYADLGEQANALVLSHHVTNSPHSGFYETLTNPETWAALRSRFLTCQSQLTAFHNYYADLHEKTRLSVIVQQRAQQKLRQEQERDARIIRYVIIGMVALFAILGVAFGYSMHKTYLQDQYATAKQQYEKSLAPHNDLLFHSGGPQWRAIEEDVSTARNLARRPGKGAAYYRSALSALPAAVAEAEAFKRQAKLADALGVARLTKAAGQWQACLASVGEALALDPSHAEALALKRAAESVQLAAEERDRLEKIASALAAARQAQASGDFSTCATRAGEALALEAGNAEAAALKRAAEGNLARKDPAEGQGWTSRAAGMEFVWVPALKIWVGKYEVTNGEYRKKEPRHYSERYEGQSLNSDRQPVVYVNFEEAKAYATWLTQREQSLLGGLRYRVISETEWQTAAQCGDGRDYPWGAGMPPKYGNYADTSAKRVFSGWTAIDRYDDGYAVTCPVEQSGKNDWGLYGMGGNVWECCAADTSGGAFGAWRGASWYNNDPGNLRCASHLDLSGSRRGLSYGFRLVLSR